MHPCSLAFNIENYLLTDKFNKTYIRPVSLPEVPATRQLSITKPARERRVKRCNLSVLDAFTPACVFSYASLPQQSHLRAHPHTPRILGQMRTYRPARESPMSSNLPQLAWQANTILARPTWATGHSNVQNLSRHLQPKRDKASSHHTPTYERNRSEMTRYLCFGKQGEWVLSASRAP